MSVWEVIGEVGDQLLARLSAMVTELELDRRDLPIVRGAGEEAELARMLLAAAWYTLNYCNPVAFPLTPLCKTAMSNSDAFTLQQLLQTPHPIW